MQLFQSLAKLFGSLGRRYCTVPLDESVVPNAQAYISTSPDGMRVFQPWLIDPDISDLIRDIKSKGKRTLVNWDRLWILKCAVLQTQTLAGEIWETGVYQGGTALFLKRLASTYRVSGAIQARLRFFDTFSGLPSTDATRDLHHEGEFSDTTLDEVQRLVGTNDFITYHHGLIPDTFVGLEHSQIRIAHIDLDLYQGTRSALSFIYPRLVPGGVIVCDDYGFISCPGVRHAVDEFFRSKRETPVILPTGQAVVHRLPTGTSDCE